VGLETKDLVTDYQDPRDAAEFDEFHQLVRTSLSRLRLEDREVLILKYALEWSSARIGDCLDLSAEAVDMRLSRARRRLAEILKDAGVTDVGLPHRAGC
jgi:RNA polymerase sigma-70 factor (ECF subfamily)